jgi:hypothetical protein
MEKSIGSFRLFTLLALMNSIYVSQCIYFCSGFGPFSNLLLLNIAVECSNPASYSRNPGSNLWQTTVYPDWGVSPFLPSKLTKAVMHLSCIWELKGSNLCRDTDYHASTLMVETVETSETLILNSKSTWLIALEDFITFSLSSWQSTIWPRHTLWRNCLQQ